MSRRVAPFDGLVVVDKPGGVTSHDVVARVRRLAGTRRVGHAGTLDPMATGVLVLGIERATRLLGHLALTEKEYDATIRLGQSMTTDDAEGEALDAADASAVTDEALRTGLAGQTGDLLQVPSAYSAVKVAGVRSYARARAGERVELAARPVTVRRLDLLGVRRDGPLVDVDVSLTCSSGTYVRALARDLGGALGVGGHLTALRRTRVGHYELADARTLDQLAALVDAGEAPLSHDLASAVGAAFPRRTVDDAGARVLSHGGRLTPTGRLGPVGVFGLDGAALALVEDRDGAAHPVVVFAPA